MAGSTPLSKDLGNVAGDIFSFLLPAGPAVAQGLDSEVPKVTTDTGNGSSNTQATDGKFSTTSVLKYAIIGAVVLVLAIGGWLIFEAFKKKG
jgi:hypothetical protein